jgi:D-alanyl-D-alanine carboxypeptidase (penicillin-binding protein 5/6)
MISPLQGGARRSQLRRSVWRGRIVALLAVLLPAGGVASAWFLLSDNGGAIGGGPARQAAATPATKAHAPAASPSPPGSPYAVALERPDAFAIRFRHGRPRAALVFDVRTGRVLWRLHPLSRLPIASLTKLMTALIVVDRTSGHERARVTRDALRYQGSGVGLLPKGRHVSVEALLYGLLLPSGNDAAIALADHVSGGRRAFVRLMNEKARELGLRCTRFVSPHGLENGNRSCPADLAALSRAVLRHSRLARIVRKDHAVVRFPIKGGKLYLNSTNPLLRAGYPGTVGLKTGDTDAAGHCLIAIVRRGPLTLGVVLLHSPNPPKQARELLNKGFRADRP